jgi:hypothetical protein
VIATSIVFAFIATATAAAMLWSGAPADICLCPGRTAPKALAQASTQQAEALAGLPRTTPIPLAGAGKVSLSPLSAVGASMSARDGDDKPRSTSAAAARGWAPWGTSSDHRATSASFSSHGGGALGGLWRGMSPFGGHGSSSTHQTEHTPTVHSTHPVSTPRPPSSRPGPPSTPGPVPAPVPAPPATVPPTTPGAPWPLPAPAPSQTPVPLPLPGGGPAGGGVGGSGGISAAATPEPGSLALIATGVFGLFVARRRRNP